MAANLYFQARRDSDKHSQLTADNHLILFGLPESNLILELKSDINEFIEYSIGISVSIYNVFCLGKFSALSSKCPTPPVLLKLATAWDHKIILLHKRKIRDYIYNVSSYMRMFYPNISFDKMQSILYPRTLFLFLRSHIQSLLVLDPLTL